jgi:hypothetical protein
MDRRRALEILSLQWQSGESVITTSILKRHYRLYALKWHPDKCNDAVAKERFIEGREAYEYLQNEIIMFENNNNDDDDTDTDTDTDNNKNTSSTTNSYSDMLSQVYREFFREVWPQGEKYFVANGKESLPKLVFLLHRFAPFLMKRETVCKVFEFLLLYHESFHLEESMIQKMRSFLKTVDNEEDDNRGHHNTKDTNYIMSSSSSSEDEDEDNDEEKEIYILHPTLQNLMEDMVFIKGDEVKVPLWCRQIVYGNQIFLCSPPELPAHMILEDDNTLHVEVSWTVAEIWGRRVQTTQIEGCEGTKEVEVPLSSLRLTEEKQPVVIHKGGILKEGSLIDRANIVIWVQLRWEA